MKKIFLFVSTVILLVALLCPAVYADVIAMPHRNSFFNDHVEECVYVDRNYTVNDTVAVFSSPDHQKILGHIEADSIINISHVYTAPDGTQWGISLTDGYTDGVWMLMSKLTVVYDYISFEEQYGHTFTAYDASKHVLPEGAICLSTYPNSGVVARYSGQPDDSEYIASVIKGIDKVYTDEAGISWGFISYYYGVRNTWVAFADVTEALETAVFHSRPQLIGNYELDSSVVITTVATPVDIEAPIGSDDPEIVQPHSSYAEPQNEWVFPTVIALTLAAAAGVLIVIFIRKNKSAKGN